MNYERFNNKLRYAGNCVKRKIVFTIFPLYFARPMITFLAKQNKVNLIGVEIGVNRGHNAEIMLKMLNIKKLYLVDPYETYVQDERLVQSSYHYAKEAMSRLIDFTAAGRVEFIRKKSVEAANYIYSGLDFVYIDGNHTYEDVSQEIKLYYPKIKKGGIIGGHDYDGGHLGVCRAVNEFIKREKLALQGGDRDWWTIKESI